MPPSLRDLVMAAPRPLRKFVRHRLLPPPISNRLGRFIDSSRKALFLSKDQPVGLAGEAAVPVKALCDKLYGGFSEAALEDLEAAKRSPWTTAVGVAQASRALGNWYLSLGEIERAYENAVFARVARRQSAFHAIQLNLESDCLCHMGEQLLARRLVEIGLEKDANDVNLRLSLANTYATPERAISEEDDLSRLEELNQIYLKSSLAPLQRMDPTRPLAIDNIHAPSARPKLSFDAQPKVSVIICAYRAASTLHIAVDSVLRQTWSNLEIIIVDDQSPDETFALAQGYAQRDARVIALRQEVNSGPYRGRNLAMKHVTGDFVTVHDADDWSHPQKIEVQVMDLMRQPRTAANFTDWVRCLPHLYFRGMTRGGASRVGLNHSSLMLRPEVVRAVGGWDEVRFAADTEFNRRVEVYSGLDRIPRLFRDVPLAFALDLPSSLTRQSLTHVLTRFHGVRRTYHDAAAHYRDHAGKAAYRISTKERPFPAPRPMLSADPEPERSDLLVIMDWALGGGAYVSAVNYLKAALRQNMRVSVFHYRRYDLDVRKEPSAEILQMAQDGHIYRVSPGERVIAKTVLVGYPVILKHTIDLPPRLECERFGIIVNQMNARLYSGGDPQYDPLQLVSQVEKMFGKRPFWIPISELVRDLMVKDGRYAPIHEATWNPLIETEIWCRREPRWRGLERQRPVIGRHARDHYTKWPTAAVDIAAAYCVEKPCTVEILGGAGVPTTILGGVPSNWKVHPFGSLDAQEFLQGLDFWVHYPNEDYIEEFGRAVIEAMSIGVPVILPPNFERTFGGAALYADPDGVFEVVQRLWRDEQAWLARVQAGRKFVLENNDVAQFEGRMKTLLGGGAWTSGASVT